MNHALLWRSARPCSLRRILAQRCILRDLLACSLGSILDQSSSYEWACMAVAPGCRHPEGLPCWALCSFAVAATGLQALLACKAGLFSEEGFCDGLAGL